MKKKVTKKRNERWEKRKYEWQSLKEDGTMKPNILTTTVNVNGAHVPVKS